MHVVIVGAGAIGASLAALLVRAGRRVTLVARGEQLEALRERPLRVTGALGEFDVRIPVAEAPPNGADVYVVTVKMPDLPKALAALPQSEAPVVTMQNGLRAEDVAAEAVGARRVVGCVTSYDAEYLRAGEVRVGRVGGLTLGRPRGAPDAAVDAARAALAPAMPARATANLRGARWTKLLVNLNNAIPAATGLSIQEAFRDARIARLSVRMMREAARVARAEGVRFERLPWANPALVLAVASLPEGIAARLVQARVRRSFSADEPAYGSTYQSIQRGRPTEIDHLNGEVVRLGRAKRLSIAANAAVQRAVRRVEHEGRFWSVERLLHEVRPED